MVSRFEFLFIFPENYQGENYYFIFGLVIMLYYYAFGLNYELSMERVKNILFPVALAVLLPVLNLFSNKEVFEFSLDVFHRWLLASIVLYLLWHLLDKASHSRGKIRVLKIVIAIVVGSTFAYVLSTLLIVHVWEPIRWNLILKLLLASILFLIIQRVLSANADIARLQLEKQEMQAEHYKVQLQELRTRVDPHFLFNSLNTLRMMVRSKHSDSERFVMSLSDFYRQTLKYNESSAVALSEELGVLKSYLFLVEARNEGGVKVLIDINEASLGIYLIPTLSLQIVVENCFKHNTLSSANPLQISITSVDGLYISVKNNIRPKFTTPPPSGYGLDNIAKRYRLLGVLDGMMITHTDEVFEVKLKLIER